MDALTRTDVIRALEIPSPPSASFGGTPLTGFPPLRVFFSDASTGDARAASGRH